ncbi:hypothetical protein AVEN_132139-1 [Araneus ventricosus]|uniref:Uncharacterized protein n=1 Tax=Araneus ventricosus TaxID=182803 RepID=A0A4Y2TLX8_ARAVE|nr:hypothetical protein AVEN_132139-1 [Araneus ventricosus]
MKLDIPRVGERRQEFCDFEPCLRTNSGTSANALPTFSTKMGGGKTSLRTTGIASLLVNALSIWQDKWDNGETGRSTYEIVPNRVSNKPVGWSREELMFFQDTGLSLHIFIASIFERMTYARAEK